MSIAGRAGIYLIALIISLCSLLGFSAPVYGQSAVETWNLPYGIDVDPATFNVWQYPTDDTAVTLADVEDTMPSQLLIIWYYGGPGVGWKFFVPGLSGNTLTELVPGNIYFGIVSHATSWEIPTPDIEKAVSYLCSGYNPELRLVYESPDLPSRYYLVSDNLWVMFALQLRRPEIASQIESKLKSECATHGLPCNSEGLPISYAHEAVIGESISIPFRTSHDPDYTVEVVSQGIIMRSAYDGNNTIGDWQQYADLLCYAALSRYNEGNITAARGFFEIAEGMWHEKGIADKPFSEPSSPTYHEYQTYKLGLLLYTSNVLGRHLDFAGELLNRLWLQQDEDGGFITGYNINGDSVGYTNSETTSIVLISLESLGH
jgi:hypothetical protein